MNFSQMLKISCFSKRSFLCVGLDPDPEKIPVIFKESKEPFYDFNRAIIDATAPYAAAFKPQNAYYAAYGKEVELEKTVHYIKSLYPEIPVILDSKRGDIGNTARMYAREAFERYSVDAVTVNPYMGWDSLEPFFQYDDKGVFVLCRTSNAGGEDLQNLVVNEDQKLFRQVVTMCRDSTESSNLGFVVGATAIEELKEIRKAAKNNWLLVPGIGAQGGDLGQVLRYGLIEPGFGVIVNASRSILYASKGADFAQAAAKVCETYVDTMKHKF